MLAAQSAASASTHSADASFRAAEEVIESLVREKAVGKTKSRKKKDVMSENVRLRERNSRLLAENRVLIGRNGPVERRPEELKLTLKRQVCFLDEFCYIYMDAMNCLISIFLLRIVSIVEYFLLVIAINEEDGRPSAKQTKPIDVNDRGQWERRGTHTVSIAQGWPEL